MTQRIISKTIQNSWHQGFLGKEHSASAVLENISYQDSDPFIVFMDDKLDLPGGPPVGGPHPHAGFEILTLVLQGNDKEWKAGSFELLTAGKGIIHSEEITSEQKLHILQVWIALPPEKRWTQPFLQRILPENVPTLKDKECEIRVYSGSSNGLSSSVRNHTPLTLVDFRMEKNAVVTQEIPANYNGLIYVLEGSVNIGDKIVRKGQTGWLDQTKEESQLHIRSSENHTHFILYAAQPHNVPIISHGPFIGDSMEDIARLYKEFRNGEMPHLNDLPEHQKIDL